MTGEKSRPFVLGRSVCVEIMSIGSGFRGSPITTVLTCAIGSRLALTALFLLWRLLADSYDTSSTLNLPCLSNSSWLASTPSSSSSTPGLKLTWPQSLGRALEATIVWDGVYYVRIAECGYEYEQVHAFLPALPLLMRSLTMTVFRPLISSLGLRSTLALSGYAISNVAFVLAAYFLHQLSLAVLKERKQAIWTAVLFCFNPASTFYSAVYSESLFALCSFAGLLYFLRGLRWAGVILFGLSSATRSNGILHAGFILFQAMHKSWAVVYHRENTKDLQKVILVVLVALFQSAIVIAPFVAFQYYGYTQFCLREGTSQRRPWCGQTVPYIYGFVQKYYWNVGFLRYFQLKQMPNFLLASPMLVLAFLAVLAFANRQPGLFFSLGLAAPHAIRAKLSYAPIEADIGKIKISRSCDDTKMTNMVAEEANVPTYDTGQLRRRKGTEKGGDSAHHQTDESSGRTGFDSPEILCFLFQLSFMFLTATLVMHVQVATRFLSVCPPVYWYLSSLIFDERQKARFRLWWTAFMVYTGVGSLLFINFYPFT